MKRLTVREFRAELPRLEEEVEVVRYAHTIGYFIPQALVSKRAHQSDEAPEPESMAAKEIRRRIAGTKR